MCKLSVNIDGWEISEDGEILFSEIESLPQALAIAEAHGLVLTEIDDQLQQRAA